MKSTLLVFILVISIPTFSQSLSLKTLLKVYNSNNITQGLEVLKKDKSLAGRSYITEKHGESMIVIRIGNDSMTARKQGAPLIVHCNVLRDAKIFEDLKLQASQFLKLIETTPGESLGTKRMHYVFGLTKPVKKGDPEIIFSKCTVIDSGEVYYQFNIFPKH